MRKSSARFTVAVTVLVALLGVLPSAAWAAGDAAAGKTLFGTKCKTCHGADGKGNAGMAKMLKVEIKDLGSPDIQKKSDADLKKTVMDGSGKMKPVAGVTGADLDNVIAFVRTLKQ